MTANRKSARSEIN